MQPLRKDPETGFLEGDSKTERDHQQIFSAAKKEYFLQEVHDYIDKYNCYPDLQAICKKVGVSHRNVRIHRNIDPLFRAKYEEILAKLHDIYTSKLAQKAENKIGTIANIAVLRFIEAGTFQEKRDVILHNESTDRKIIDNALVIDVDPEVSPPPQKLIGNQSDGIGQTGGANTP